MQFSNFSRLDNGLTVTLYNDIPIENVGTIKYYKDNATGLFSKKEFRWSFNNEHWSSWEILTQSAISNVNTFSNYYLFLQIRYTLSAINSGKISTFTLNYENGTATLITPRILPEDIQRNDSSAVLIHDILQEHIITRITDSSLLNGYPGSWYLDRSHHTGRQPVSSIIGLESYLKGFNGSTYVDVSTFDASIAEIYSYIDNLNPSNLVDVSTFDASIAEIYTYINSSINTLYIDINSSFNYTENLILDINSSINDINLDLNNKLDKSGGNITGELSINGSLYVFGNIYQDGSSYTTHAEEIYTTDDFITLRDGAVSPLADTSISGLRIKIPNGVNDVLLGTGNDAIMRIGWDASSLVPLAAREDNPSDGWFAQWNASLSIFETFDIISYINASLGNINQYVKKTGDTMTGTLFNNSTGISIDVSGNINVINGYIISCSSTSQGTRFGDHALADNIDGLANVAFGNHAQEHLQHGTANVAVGAYASHKNVLGNNIVAIGNAALHENQADNNIAIGSATLWFNNPGAYNTAVGGGAMYYNVSGNLNTAFGALTLYSNAAGSNNTATGTYAAYYLDGSDNLVEGFEAADYIADGATPLRSLNQSVILGAYAYPLADKDYNEIVIGCNAIGNGSNTITLGNNSIVKTILKGKIGVNEPNPIATLDVSGSINIDGSITSLGSLYVNAYTYCSTFANANYNGYVYFGDSVRTTGIGGTNVYYGGGYYTGTAHDFYGNATHSTISTVRIFNARAAAAGLRVQGAVGQTGNIQEWVDSSANILSVINRIGYLGIGINNPSTALDVSGNLRVISSNDSSTVLYVDSSNKYVGVVSTNPTHSLEIDGNYSTNNAFFIKNKTGSGGQDFIVSNYGQMTLYGATFYNGLVANTNKTGIHTNKDIGVAISSDSRFGFSSTTSWNGAQDVNISRAGVNTIGIGNGATNNITGGSLIVNQLGVGQKTPVATLDVSGSVKIDGSTVINKELYLGDSNTDGSYRFVIDSSGLNIQKRESGVWNTKTII